VDDKALHYLAALRDQVSPGAEQTGGDALNDKRLQYSQPIRYLPPSGAGLGGFPRSPAAGFLM
jgi:hypothetical protein